MWFVSLAACSGCGNSLASLADDCKYFCNMPDANPGGDCNGVNYTQMTITPGEQDNARCTVPATLPPSLSCPHAQRCSSYFTIVPMSAVVCVAEEGILFWAHNTLGASVAVTECCYGDVYLGDSISEGTLLELVSSSLPELT